MLKIFCLRKSNDGIPSLTAIPHFVNNLIGTSETGSSKKGNAELSVDNRIVFLIPLSYKLTHIKNQISLTLVCDR